jgi:hypothetical protein
MIRMVALKPWFNADHEGSINPGQEFESPPSRARDLIRLGLAIAAIGDGSKIKVVAEPAPATVKPVTRKRPDRRALLQLAAGGDFIRMLDLTNDLHARYCRTVGAEFITRREARPRKPARPPHWRKVDLIAEALDAGFDQVIWLDADSVIVDGSVDLFAVCRWGLGICECWDSPRVPPHLNTGVVWFNASPEVRAFVTAWNKMPPGMPWEDQGAFIELMKTRRWRSQLTILPNRYNWVETHMEAAGPVVRSFHGERDRLARMQGLLLQGTAPAVAA